jgi:carboxypeptidase Taq
MLNTFYSNLAELKNLQHIRGVLHWDQQVCLPNKAAGERAEQLELMARLIHQRSVAPEFADIVDELAADSERYSEEDQVNIRETKRSLDRQRKLPSSFVAEQAKVSSLCWNAWTKARLANNFAAVADMLDAVFKLAREEAHLVGFEEHPYDALLELYEPGGRLSVVKPLLLELGDELAAIWPKCAQKTAQNKRITGEFDEVSQSRLAETVLKHIGFDFGSGRLDKTHHPFMTGLGSHDFRVTTRYDQSDYVSSLLTVLHEGGHALYEMGLEKRWAGTPMGRHVSLVIHESQSRLWENFIGRSRPFSKYLHRIVSEIFPHQTEHSSPNDLWATCNKVEPSLIRVESDEVTYSLHIIIRLLLEERIIGGDLSARDLPEAWAEMYQKYLGITPPTDREGVLQDTQWFGGSLGYFPTYALGNVFAAMMVEKIREDSPGLDSNIEQGEFQPLLLWLNQNIHQHGMRYYSTPLVEKACQRKVSVGPFISYLKAKFEV